MLRFVRPDRSRGRLAVGHGSRARRPSSVAVFHEEEMLRGLGGAILVLNMSLGPTFVDRQGAKEDKTNAELRRRGASARRAAARCKR